MRKVNERSSGDEEERGNESGINLIILDDDVVRRMP